jgi:hypothetical protein
MWLQEIKDSITVLWFSWSSFDTSISFVGTATKLLKMWLYKTTVVYPLKPGEQVVLSDRYLQPVHEGELDLKLQFSRQGLDT